MKVHRPSRCLERATEQGFLGADSKQRLHRETVGLTFQNDRRNIQWSWCDVKQVATVDGMWRHASCSAPRNLQEKGVCLAILQYASTTPPKSENSSWRHLKRLPEWSCFLLRFYSFFCLSFRYLHISKANKNPAILWCLILVLILGHCVVATHAALFFFFFF